MSDKIKLYTPVELSQDELSIISNYLKNKHSLTGEVVQELDDTLIAGVKIRYKDLIIDLSVSGKLDRIANELGA